MSTEPEFFTLESLARAAGISITQLYRHLRYDVGQITKARERVPGLGIRFTAAKCRKYLSLVRAGREAA